MLSSLDQDRAHKTDRAKKLRRLQTEAEQVIWKYVRAKRCKGCKFRRQVPVGPFIVDFLCVGARLAIVIDDEDDRMREDYLQTWGFRVLRFTERQIIGQTKAVLKRVGEFL